MERSIKDKLEERTLEAEQVAQFLELKSKDKDKQIEEAKKEQMTISTMFMQKLSEEKTRHASREQMLTMWQSKKEQAENELALARGSMAELLDTV